MDLRCPKCSSTDLTKVSLAYQEGLFHVTARTRMLGLLFASGGPDIMVGRATTSGVQQSALSKSLVPPTKWSYLKLILWSAAISFVSLVAYVRVSDDQPAPRVFTSCEDLRCNGSARVHFRSGGTITPRTKDKTLSGISPSSARGAEQ